MYPSSSPRHSHVDSSRNRSSIQKQQHLQRGNLISVKTKRKTKVNKNKNNNKHNNRKNHQKPSSVKKKIGRTSKRIIGMSMKERGRGRPLKQRMRRIRGKDPGFYATYVDDDQNFDEQIYENSRLDNNDNHDDSSIQAMNEELSLKQNEDQHQTVLNFEEPTLLHYLNLNTFKNSEFFHASNVEHRNNGSVGRDSSVSSNSSSRNSSLEKMIKRNHETSKKK